MKSPAATINPIKFSIFYLPSRIFSHHRTYTMESKKKTVVTATKMISNIGLLLHRSRFELNHQVSPKVSVFCSFFNTPSFSVRKKGRLEKSLRYSMRPRKPSASR